MRNLRSVSPDDKATLKEAVIEYKNSLRSCNCLILDHVTSHGFSDSLIEDILTNCPEIFPLSDVLEKFPFFSIARAKAILEILNEVCEDISDCEELMAMIEDVFEMETMEQFWNDVK